ncbi:N-acetylglucosamine/diacetylchitobiose ABC transporter substrate-binding protein [Streptomyces sp. NPDC059009]|uniref:N-acetylglucosamine/diacetylchitobiose ABC transporter substrate-binding protein n=1 Tax=Streptomyces sp. NPDC059009 TaxID=3346694 RepID=UPI0036A00340
MGSTSGTSGTPQTPSTSGIGRRDLIKRAAALGIVSVPTMSVLSACASGGGSDDDKAKKGKKTKDNPFGAGKGNDLDVFIFKGGYGDSYAKVWEASFEKKYGGDVAHTGEQDVTGKLQPRFNKGNPPDVVDDSGSKKLKLDTLFKDGQLTDLTQLLDAPSVDDPSKKVRDIMLPGTIEQGTFGGKFHALFYVYAAWGVWYSNKLFKKHGWKAPKTWDDFIGIMKDAKSKGIGGFAHQGKYPYYMNIVIMDLIAKTGGMDSVKKIDNLDPKAFVGNPAAERSIEAIYEIVEKGLLMPGTNSLEHTEAQTKWNEYKAVFIPSGSWLENEQAKQTPADFEMTFLPLPLLPDSKMKLHAVRTGADEPFVVPSKAKNVEGGLEFLRRMLSKEGATAFAKEASSLSVLGPEFVDKSVQLRPGIKSALAAVDACPVPERFNFRYPEWYSEMDVAIQNATGELMAKRITPKKWLERAQKATDAEAEKNPKNKR